MLYLSTILTNDSGFFKENTGTDDEASNLFQEALIKATKKIKEQAASLGEQIIYIQDQTSDKGIRRVNRSIKSGVPYGYQ